MYYVISRQLAPKMKSDSCFAGSTIVTLTCRACIIRPSHRGILCFNQGDLIVTTDMDFCDSTPLSLMASLRGTPFLDHVFKHVPPAVSRFHVYSVAEARQSVFNSVRMELPKFLMSIECHLRGLISSTSPIQTRNVPCPRRQPLQCLHIYLLTPLFVSPCCWSPCPSSPVLASFCSTDSGVGHFRTRSSSVPVLPVVFNIRHITLKMLTPLFCTFPWLSFVLYWSWPRKPFVDRFLLFGLPLLTLILTPLLTPILTLSFPRTHFRTPSTAFTLILLHQSTENSPRNPLKFFSRRTSNVIFSFLVPHLII